MNKITIGNCTLYHGDCLEMLNEIPDGSIDLVVCDPPYGCAFIPNHRKILPITDILPNDDKPRTEFVAPIVKTVRNGGAVYLCTRFDVMPLWSNALKDAGANLKVPIVWDKITASQGDLYGSYANRLEVVLFAHIGRHRFRQGRPDNLWTIPRPPASLHPTVKPVELFRRCLLNSSDSGSLVLDPFLGTGTTAIACILTGRRFIGVEIDDRYFEISCERIEQAYREINHRLPGFEPETLEQTLLFN